MKITIDGLRGIDEVLNIIGNYSKNVRNILKGQNWYNLQEAIRAEVIREIENAGFNEKGKRSVRLANAFEVERDKSSTRDNIVYNIGINENYLDTIENNVDFHGNKREGLTGEEMISFMEVGRKAYKIPKRKPSGNFLVFKNKSTGDNLVVLPVGNGQQYNVPSTGGGANFDRVVDLRLQQMFDNINEKIEREMNNI